MSPFKTAPSNAKTNKAPAFLLGLCSYLASGDDLLSHGETPHYHRRGCVSLLSSEWIQVVPQLYCHQTNSVGTKFTPDRDRTVSRRSEPSSRTTLNGEQPYPWDRLQPQDVMSRHRGAKHRRRYELLGGISLLSPEYLLSVERWPFHTEPPDH